MPRPVFSLLLQLAWQLLEFGCLGQRLCRKWFLNEVLPPGPRLLNSNHVLPLCGDFVLRFNTLKHAHTSGAGIRWVPLQFPFRGETLCVCVLPSNPFSPQTTRSTRKLIVTVIPTIASSGRHTHPFHLCDMLWSFGMSPWPYCEASPHAWPPQSWGPSAGALRPDSFPLDWGVCPFLWELWRELRQGLKQRVRSSSKPRVHRRGEH